MARWTGEPNIDDVLAAADAWRERCIIADGSLFSSATLWTLENLQELKQRYVENPIEDAKRSFYDKFKEQLDGSRPEINKLAAEVLWLYLLVPHHSKFGPKKKHNQIKMVWEWSGEALPDTPYLNDEKLMGVSYPGTAYLTRRHDEISFLLDFLNRWKKLSRAERDDLMQKDTPWGFVEWLDKIDGADRRPIRNAVLYFLFPDTLERNLSNEHRRTIVTALKHKLPDELRPKGRNLSLLSLDKVIHELRKQFEAEMETKEIDFYKPPIYQQWSIGIREDARNEISTGLKKVLSEYDLELRQCGSKKKNLVGCKPVNEATGFWTNPTDATNKPLRWIIHIELENDQVVAKVPEQHGSRRIAFANTAQGTSGAVTTRIIPAIKVEDKKYVFYETWEWLLLHAFLPALPIGSSGQLFDDFNPETGRLEYMNHEQDYIAAALITLNEEDDPFAATELPRQIKYGDATKALSELINISLKFVKGYAAEAPEAVEQAEEMAETAETAHAK